MNKIPYQNAAKDDTVAKLSAIAEFRRHMQLTIQSGEQAASDLAELKAEYVHFLNSK